MENLADTLTHYNTVKQSKTTYHHCEKMFASDYAISSIVTSKRSFSTEYHLLTALSLNCCIVGAVL